MSARRICLVGFGEVGAILADDLVARDCAVSAWDIKFSDPTSKPSRAAATREVRQARNAVDAARDADVIISAVTAAHTVEAARACGRLGGAFYLDVNSASPEAKRQAAILINDAGGRYVEAAVMSPIAPKRIASPILLGGPNAEAWLTETRDLGFANCSVFSNEYGKAAAAKLCRSIVIKGLEALLCQSMLAARRYGVEDAVLASLSDILPGPDWRQLAPYMIQRSIEHGERRAEEMREAARTVAEANLAPMLTQVVADRHEWAANFKSALAAQDFATLLDSMLAEAEHQP